MEGKYHAAASLMLAGPVGLGAILVTEDLLVGTLAAVGCAAGVILSPDLDHTAVTYSERVVYNFNKFLGFLWQLYWLPYARMVSHRSWLSHGLVVGTLVRIVYMLTPAWIAAAIAGWSLVALQWTLWLWPFWLGLMASDALHALMDMF